MSNELDQFEPAEDVTEDFGASSPNPGIVISVRLPSKEAERLAELAEDGGETLSQIARPAILSFIKPGGRKAPQK